ncbi:hypothetical protein [Arthrobacter monumenti]
MTIRDEPSEWADEYIVAYGSLGPDITVSVNEAPPAYGDGAVDLSVPVNTRSVAYYDALIFTAKESDAACDPNFFTQGRMRRYPGILAGLQGFHGSSQFEHLAS